MSTNGDEQNENNDGDTGALEDVQESALGGLLPNKNSEEEEENNEEDNNEKENNEEENANENPEEEDNQSHRSSQQSKQSQRSHQTQQSSQVHEPDGENSSRRSTTRSRQSNVTTSTSSKKKSKYDMKEVTDLSAQIYQGQPITTDDPDLIAAAILDLQDMRYQFECEKKFDEALKAVQAIDRAREVQKEKLKKLYSNEEVEEVNQKIEKSKRQLSRLNKKAEDQINQLNYDLDELVENLRKRQEAEIERHDQIWTSESKVRDFNRTSGKVRALRYQQQKMLNSKRYAEAEQVRRIADRTVAMEAQMAYKQMQNEYQESLDLLLKKHQEEMDNLLIANAAKKRDLQHKIDKRKAPIILRISQLENEEKLARDEDRVWNHRYKLDSASISKRMGLTADANVQSARLRIPKYNKMKLPPLETSSLKKTVMSRRTSRL